MNCTGAKSGIEGDTQTEFCIRTSWQKPRSDTEHLRERGLHPLSVQTLAKGTIEVTAIWRPCVAVPLSPKKRQSHETEYAFTPLLISKLAHAAFITGYKKGSWPSKDLMTTHTHTHPCAWGHQVPCQKNKALTWKGLEAQSN